MGLGVHYDVNIFKLTASAKPIYKEVVKLYSVKH